MRLTGSHDSDRLANDGTGGILDDAEITALVVLATVMSRIAGLLRLAVEEELFYEERAVRFEDPALVTGRNVLRFEAPPGPSRLLR